MNARQLARYWANVDASGGLDACWPWQGNRQDGGYGRISIGAGRVAYAHRVALEIKLGRPIADGMFSCHTCDNPPCCNPAHLFEGTCAENLADSARKGRKPIGSANVRAKLTTDQVVRIRRAGEPVGVLAAELGVTTRTIYRVRSRAHYFAEGAA